MNKRFLLTILLIYGCLSMNAQLESDLFHVAWQNQDNVSIDGETITKIGANGWNAGMFSVNKLGKEENGAIEHRVENVDMIYMFGLSDIDENTMYNTIDYAWFINRGSAYIYKNGRYLERFESEPGEVFHIEKVEGVVYYLKNGVPMYEIPIEGESTDLYVDVSIYNTGTFEFEIVATFEEKYDINNWRSLDNVNVSGDNFIKTTNTGWNAGFFSEGKIPSNQDGYIEHQIADQSKYYMVGLSDEDVNLSYNRIDYAWYVRPYYSYIYINGRYQGGFRSSVGDVLRIEKIGDKVYMKKNGVTMRIYPSIDGELHIDASLYHGGFYDISIKTSFPNPSNNYVLLKKRMDGNKAIFTGDIKFKFNQEYSVANLTGIEYQIFDWERNIIDSGALPIKYGVNWYSIPSSSLLDGEEYTMIIKGNKEQTYYLNFRYKEGW